MKTKTFEDFLSDKCQCHTNNDPAGFENWVEQLDSQELTDFAQEYGSERYAEGFLAGQLQGMETANMVFSNLNK